jgi:enamine deaminase RidA (YjgF/YER057c/UK114 family)
VIKKTEKIIGNGKVKAAISLFKPAAGVAEAHVILNLANVSKLSTEEQFSILEKAINEFTQTDELSGMNKRFVRYFVSDSSNQQNLVNNYNADCSIIQQPPLNGSKAVVWVYYSEKTKEHYNQTFITQLTGSGKDVYDQTKDIFEKLDLQHCLRTWVYVNDIDNRYAGMVKARREVFEQNGLTPQTHFIASTGIEGRSVDPHNFVTVDAYSVADIKPEQIVFLHGKSHLNPTHEYGVTFERGVKIIYGDRSHIIISGTASINNKGEIMFPGDVDKQTVRMTENIETLLFEAGSSFADVCHLIVYLRDLSDYAKTKAYFDRRFPDIPTAILLAPVCRPGWLIEAECMAITNSGDRQFREL